MSLPTREGHDNDNNFYRLGPRLRSKSSARASYIRFLNTTTRRVDVIWINYDGVRVKYKVYKNKMRSKGTSMI
jgi:hypothetical protein